MKNECNSIKNLTTLCPGIKCHSRFLSYFDTSMTIANASNGILKNTQSERPFKQIIVASLSTSLSCSRHSVWFSNNTEAISKLEIERKFCGYNKGKSSKDQICNRGQGAFILSQQFSEMWTTIQKLCQLWNLA